MSRSECDVIQRHLPGAIWLHGCYFADVSDLHSVRQLWSDDAGASPNLNPEKSRSFTAGIVFEPIRNVALTVDYYQHQEDGCDHGAHGGGRMAAYYAGETIPAGFEVIPDAVGVEDPKTPRRASVCCGRS